MDSNNFAWTDHVIHDMKNDRRDLAKSHDTLIVAIDKP